MRGYSLDLRERVIRSWQQGQTQAWMAETYGMSVSTIKRYIARYREAGHVQASVPRYKPPTICDEQLGELVRQLEAQPDATLAEHIQTWGEHSGQWVSVSMMWRAIQRAGWTRKKSRWVPRNVTR